MAHPRISTEDKPPFAKLGEPSARHIAIESCLQRDLRRGPPASATRLQLLQCRVHPAPLRKSNASLLGATRRLVAGLWVRVASTRVGHYLLQSTGRRGQSSSIRFASRRRARDHRRLSQRRHPASRRVLRHSLWRGTLGTELARYRFIPRPPNQKCPDLQHPEPDRTQKTALHWASMPQRPASTPADPQNTRQARHT